MYFVFIYIHLSILKQTNEPLDKMKQLFLFMLECKNHEYQSTSNYFAQINLSVNKHIVLQTKNKNYSEGYQNNANHKFDSLLLCIYIDDAYLKILRVDTLYRFHKSLY